MFTRKQMLSDRPVYAIEIKSVQEVQKKHLKGLHSFHDEFAGCHTLCVSLDRMTRISEGGQLMYFKDFLERLWSEQLF